MITENEKGNALAVYFKFREALEISAKKSLDIFNEIMLVTLKLSF